MMANLNGYPASVKGQIIKWMTADQIIHALNNSLFTEETARFVTPQRIAEIDFTKVVCSKAGGIDVMTALFRNDENVPKIKDKESLNHLIQFIYPKRLVHLTDSQTKWLDFSNKAIKKETLTAMANLDGYPASVIGQIIKSMTADQIVDALNNGLFEMDTAEIRYS